MNAAQMAKMNIGESVWEVVSSDKPKEEGPFKLVRWYILRKDSKLMHIGRYPRGASAERGMPVSLRVDNFYERTPLEAAANKLLRAEDRLKQAAEEAAKAEAYRNQVQEFFNEMQDNVGNMEAANGVAGKS